MNDNCMPDAVAGAVRVQALARRDGIVATVADWVADEVPVALQYNGISHAVMMVSPLDLEDFAYGFSLSEGLVDSADDLHDVQLEQTDAGLVLNIEMAARCVVRLKERRRTMAGRTGCGLCGTDSLATALPSFGERVSSATRFDAADIGAAMRQLRERQALQQVTGATHAAAWCELPSGGSDHFRDALPKGDAVGRRRIDPAETAAASLRYVREDVGRHNALDKLVGALARARVDASAGFIVVTSRASFEMVQKAAHAGVGLLVAISAPTALAIRTADDAGLCLVGFARGSDWVAYTHTDRLATVAHSDDASAAFSPALPVRITTTLAGRADDA